jgi:hypothetical protein
MSPVSLDCLDMTSSRVVAATLGSPSMLNTEGYAVEPDPQHETRVKVDTASIPQRRPYWSGRRRPVSAFAVKSIDELAGFPRPAR